MRTWTTQTTVARHPIEVLRLLTESADNGLALRANGPIEVDVEYVATPIETGSDLRASVTVTYQARALGRPGGVVTSTKKETAMSTTKEALAEVLGSVGPADRPAITLAARELTRRYGDGEAAVDALRGVSFELPRAEFAAVMGPSGSGKSTLMHLLAGLDQPTSGTAHIGTAQITGMSDRELTRLRRKHIGFVFQSFNLLPALTAEENVLLPLTLAGRKVDHAWVDSVIEAVGLADRRKHRPAELSGGQQQRVAVARALVTEPTVLFADEPTGNLDSESGQEILALLRAASDVHGQTMLMVTHDPRAAATADRVLVLADGRLVADRVQPTESEILSLMKEVAR